MTTIKIKRPLTTMIQPRIFERDGTTAAAGYVVWAGDEEAVRIEYKGPNQDVVITVFDGALENGIVLDVDPIGTEAAQT